MKKSFALIICMLLGLAVLAGCGGQTAQPVESAAAAQGGATVQQKELTEQELQTLEPLFRIVMGCSENGFSGQPDAKTASIVVYNMINYDIFTAEDGDRTDDWVSDAMLQKIYEDCFTDHATPLDFSSYTIMSRKDEGYNWKHSDMGLTPEATVTDSKGIGNDEYEVHVSLRYPEDTELTGTGTFVIHKKEDGKFGYTLSAWEYTWNA